MVKTSKAGSLNENANAWVGLCIFSFGCEFHDSFHSLSPPFLKPLHQQARGSVLEEKNEEIMVLDQACMFVREGNIKNE